jgi:hypothetical protein
VSKGKGGQESARTASGRADSKGQSKKSKSKKADADRKGSKKASKGAKGRTGTVIDGPLADLSGRSAASNAEPTPDGQRLYDVPYSAPAPRMINLDIGLHNLVSRAGHNAGYTIDVTLLDAPDHRLIRSGVLLAHRVLDGRGEWYLGAPQWQPLLPEERVEPMGQSDLPEEFADLTRPFRRRDRTQGGAALSCERSEFALRDDRGTTMALLRDDKVTVRRGGLTTARYREVMITPTGPGLTDEQVAHVGHALSGVGATQVSRFPRLVARLGAPATGPTDFPPPQSLEQDTSFSQFVSHLLATRLHQLLQADLKIRTDGLDGSAELVTAATQLRVELRGLSSVIDVAFLSDLDEELEWIVGQAGQEVQRQGDTGDGRPPGDLKLRLRGERYLTLLDRLVTATRAPQVGNASNLPASEVLGSLLNVSLTALQKASGRLSVDSPPETWRAASAALEQLLQVSGVANHLLPERVELLRHRLGVASQLLAEAAKHDDTAQRSLALAATSPPAEAFSLGRAYEHELAVARTARDAFVRRWAKTAKKLE